MGEALVERLQKAFPSDVLQFELGESLPSGDDRLPKVKVPTLFVEYRAALSGSYLSVKPKAVFVGAGIRFKSTFRIPKSKKKLVHKYSVWRRPDINAVHREQLTHEQVYARMVDSAFERYQKKLLAFFFEKP